MGETEATPRPAYEAPEVTSYTEAELAMSVDAVGGSSNQIP